MKCSFLLLAVLVISFNLKAQFIDNFEDGDLTNGIQWNGNTGNYKVNTDHQLQLNSTGEGISYISAPLCQGEILEWSFWIKCSFSPSDNNHALIYLLSDQSDLNASLNGYYLKLGESGTYDAIELYRQTPNESVLIARGADGFLKDPFEMRIKVIRDDGHWEVWTDSTGTSGYHQQAVGDDDYWQTYTTFGVVCKYTSSNSTKFRFDDFYAGNRIIDSKPPELLEVVVKSRDQVDLILSESIDPESCTHVSNFELVEDIGYPVNAIRDPENDHCISLFLGDFLMEAQRYQLIIRNLKDLAGNRLDTTVNLTYYPVRQFDVVINEIMADPDPTVGLPECEYLELFNKTTHQVRLEDWKLIAGETVKELPVINIPAKGYYVITSLECDSIFEDYGPSAGITGFSLLNTGTTLTLKDHNNAVIHQVEYSPESYNNSLKESGGWSLEQIDTDNSCGGISNWAFSKSPSGGTPGKVNSINGINEDNLEPLLRAIDVPDSVSVILYFSETMDSLRLLNCDHYMVDHGVGKPLKAILENLEYNRVKLIFSSPFLIDTSYTLDVDNLLCDCAGNELMNHTSLSFGLPYPADSSNIVINEILFDPKTSGTDFVELYNRSGHFISLEELYIGLKDEVSGVIENVCRISDPGQIMIAGEYLVITQEPDLLKADYFTTNLRGIIKNKDFPILPNSGGHLILCTREGKVIDEVIYSDEMHFSLLNSTKGVSLERIDFNRSSYYKDNWHSAAQNVGFATPGYKNSQCIQAGAANGAVKVEPKAISPDNDGYNDFLTIICQPEKAGSMVTISIFDSDGRLVRLLTANNLAGDTATYTWDGTNDNNELVHSGIYIVYTELLTLTGSITKDRKAVVVTGL